MVKKKHESELTRKFMEEHGDRKKKMKISWNEYIKKLGEKEEK